MINFSILDGTLAGDFLEEGGAKLVLGRGRTLITYQLVIIASFLFNRASMRKHFLCRGTSSSIGMLKVRAATVSDLA